MGIKIWSRFTQTAVVTGPYIAYKDTIAITAPSFFIPFPFLMNDTYYHVRWSCYNGDETVGCDQFQAEQLINGFTVHPMVDATFKFEIIV